MSRTATLVDLSATRDRLDKMRSLTDQMTDLIRYVKKQRSTTPIYESVMDQMINDDSMSYLNFDVLISEYEIYEALGDLSDDTIATLHRSVGRSYVDSHAFCGLLLHLLTHHRGDDRRTVAMCYLHEHLRDLFNDEDIYGQNFDAYTKVYGYVEGLVYYEEYGYVLPNLYEAPEGEQKLAVSLCSLKDEVDALVGHTARPPLKAGEGVRRYRVVADRALVMLFLDYPSEGEAILNSMRSRQSVDAELLREIVETPSSAMSSGVL